MSAADSANLKKVACTYIGTYTKAVHLVHRARMANKTRCVFGIYIKAKYPFCALRAMKEMG